jgi:hypothetical protein
VSEAAITDGLIFMAITMIIVRAAGLRLRAARLPQPRHHPAAAARRRLRPPDQRAARQGTFLAGGSRIAVLWP